MMINFTTSTIYYYDSLLLGNYNIRSLYQTFAGQRVPTQNSRKYSISPRVSNDSGFRLLW